MIHVICSVYDQAAAAYLPPFHSQSRAAAERSFMQALSDPDHQFTRFPGDYTLFALGVFDDETAEFSQLSPFKVINGVEALAKLKKIRAESNEAS